MSANSNDNRHLNPSHRKISAQRKPSGTLTVLSNPSASDDKNGSQSRGHLPSSSLSLLYQTTSQEQAIIAEENKSLRQHLQSLKHNNRTLMCRLTEKQQEISKTDRQYKELVAKYKSELQRANLQTKILLQQPQQCDITPSKSMAREGLRTSHNRQKSQDSQKSRSRTSREKFLQLKETFENLNFREVDKILNKKNTYLSRDRIL